VVYAGKNTDTGQPIIQLFLNPLVMWIWIGVAIIGFGTVLALIPNMQAAEARKKTRAPDVVVAQGGD
jgi:cytochrome c-type biogenesis protein CcmF